MTSRLLIILLLIVIQINVIDGQNEHYHDYDDYDGHQMVSPGDNIQYLDSNYHGQWLGDLDGENLTDCDRGLAESVRLVKLPFNLIGQLVRYPSHVALEFQVTCKEKKSSSRRLLTIDFNGVVRVRFGFFRFQFRRSTKARDISKKWLTVARLKHVAQTNRTYSVFSYNCKHYAREKFQEIVSMRDYYMLVI